MQTLRIALDMDDVILDLVPYWVSSYKKKTGDLRDIVVESWDVYKYLPMMKKEDVYEMLNEKSFYSGAPPVAGAVNGCRRLLKDKRFEVHIITDCNYTYCFKEKVEWLRKYISIEASNLIVGVSSGNAKRGLNPLYDIIIDDNWKNMLAENKTRILFDRPHNNDVASVWYDYRVFSWNDLLHRLDVLWEGINQERQ